MGIFRLLKKGMREAREGARHKISIYADRAQLMEMTSEQASERVNDGLIDIVFIDGDHGYEPTFQDMVLWWPKLKRGGVMAGLFGVAQSVGGVRLLLENGGRA